MRYLRLTPRWPWGIGGLRPKSFVQPVSVLVMDSRGGGSRDYRRDRGCSTWPMVPDMIYRMPKSRVIQTGRAARRGLCCTPVRRPVVAFALAPA
jgi:hypothetical protein